MSKAGSIPAYLSNDYDMLMENIESYSDPLAPDSLETYVKGLLRQLESEPAFITDMPDQLALSLLNIVKIDSKKLNLADIDSEPEWDVVRSSVSVHGKYRGLVAELSESVEQQLKIAILLLHLYHTPAQIDDESIEDAPIDNDDESYDDAPYDSDEDTNDY